jgi:hypothetical protein
MIKSLRALCFLMCDQVQGISNERQHSYSLKAYLAMSLRARFKHGGDVDVEFPST